MTQYWLGELSPETERRLEERSFADDELFERLLGVREELFDAYVRGELDEAQRAHFEQRLLQAPADQAQLEFAQALVGALDREIIADRVGDDAPASAAWRLATSWWSFLRLAWVLGCAALLLGVGWLISDNLRLRRQLTGLQAEQTAQQQRARELERQLAQTRSGNIVAQPSPPPAPTPSPSVPRTKEAVTANTLAVTLSLISLRSTGGETIRLAPEIRALRCKLLLDAPDAFSRYQVVLTQNGREIKSWRGLRPLRNGGIALMVELPTAGLSSGEYSFELRGVNDDGTIEVAGRYTFRLGKP